MRDFGDLNKLVAFARRNGVSIQINYWESDDTMSVEVSSAASTEEYSEKRILNVDSFIHHWQEFMAVRSGSEEK
jgi:hypothetical protein